MFPTHGRSHRGSPKTSSLQMFVSTHVLAEEQASSQHAVSTLQWAPGSSFAQTDAGGACSVGLCRRCMSCVPKRRQPRDEQACWPHFPGSICLLSVSVMMGDSHNISSFIINIWSLTYDHNYDLWSLIATPWKLRRWLAFFSNKTFFN